MGGLFFVFIVNRIKKMNTKKMTAKTAKLIIKELKYIENPSQSFEALLGDCMPFLLESALQMERYGRYSIFGSNPTMIIRSKNGITEITQGGLTIKHAADPLNVTDEAIRSLAMVDGDYSWLPFTGGMVGYLGYDLNRQIERIPNISIDDQGIPDIYLGFYTEAIVIDHKERKTHAISYVPASSNQAIIKAKRRLDHLIDKINSAENKRAQQPAQPPLHKREANGLLATNLTSNFNRDQYRRMIEKAKEYISIGDIFQVNLAQRFSADLKVDHYSLYKRLREKNPAPFTAFLGYHDFSILSSSPERFMYVGERYVETRPIKGTRPRYPNSTKDNLAKHELLQSEKDAAEHVMIVDVKRNDLGRVCEYGSVKVPELMVVESYETVHHMVSTVTGRLRPNVSMVDLIRASFPGGSISGAPKIRAMEIIEELEPHRRNIYTGAIGYISTHGKMDTNIVIRTIAAIKDKAYLYVGGGIVADSDPDAEYEETLDKGRGLFRALGLRENGFE